MSDKSTDALVSAIKTRAMAYFGIFDAMSEEVGAEKAEKIMSKAIYKRGQAGSKRYSVESKNGDFKALAKDFMEGGTSSLFVFGHEIVEADKDHAVFRLNRCELVNGWKEGGLNDAQVEKMCDMAYSVDFGKFEELGYNLEFSKRISAGDECCELLISRKKIRS